MHRESEIEFSYTYRASLNQLYGLYVMYTFLPLLFLMTSFDDLGSVTVVRSCYRKECEMLSYFLRS